jgi:phosphoribosylformylglycinamidine (FGAM) synthase-like enzyme
MAPWEVMTSESQERMLAIVEPGRLGEVEALCRRWDVSWSVIGHVTGSGRLRILDGFDGEVLADVPASSLSDGAPLYERPVAPRPEPDRTPRPVGDPAARLLDSLCDLSWVSSQYDSQLFLNTVEGPGGDATVLRLKHPTTGVDTGRGLALTTDGNHRWCAADAYHGTAMVVAEAVLNLACVGARPIALVNCLNFGNPEHPEVMRQLSDAIDGMGDACRAFGIPVVGGNVSLYNESRGRDIDPSPVVGLLGIVDDLDRRPPGVRLAAGDRLVVLGPPSDDLSPAPVPDLAAVSATAGLVRALARDGLVTGLHDVADGGLANALGELVARSGAGCRVEVDGPGALFSEAAGRVVASVPAAQLGELRSRAAAAGVSLVELGDAGGDRLEVAGLVDLAVDVVAATWRDRLPAAMAAGALHE